MIRAVIIDDETAAIDVISSLCNKCDFPIDLVGSANNIEDGISLVKHKNPDLVFLDVELPEGLGFELFRAIENPAFHTVFITAHESYAIDAIKHHALDYILKPVDYLEFNNMLGAVVKKIDEQNNRNHDLVKEFLKQEHSVKVAIPDTFGTIYLNAAEIVRIQADGPYSKVYLTTGKTHLTSRILKNFENAMREHRFLRVHRSHLINLQHVVSYSRIDGGILVMSNTDKVPVARKYKEIVAELLENQALII